MNVIVNPPGETYVDVIGPTEIVVQTNIPVFPNPRAWCTFADNSTQTNPVANQINTFTYDTPDGSQDISIVNNEEIVVAKDGVYNVSFSIMLTKAGGGKADIDIWAAKNGTAIPDSNTRFTLQGNGDHQVAAWILTYSLAANDSITLHWSCNQTSVTVPHFTNLVNPVRPNVPSIIGQVWQIGDTPPN
jgi:hypothetical protein